MIVDLLVENIENHLPLLSKTLPTNSQVPVLSNLLLEANSKGFFIHATDLELGVKTKIPAKIGEEGAITVPGKQFIEVINALPKDKLTISTDKEGLIVKSRNNKASFQTIAKEEFPNILEEKGKEVSEFDKEEIKNIFKKLLFSVSLDEARPELTGVLLAQKENGIDFVATDGFRLSVKSLPGKKVLEKGDKIILSARLAGEALALKEDKIKMFIYDKGNQLVFESPDSTLVGRLIRGEFPNYEKVIPQEAATEAIADTEELLQKIKLASVFARESANIIKVRIEAGGIRIYSKSSGLGEGDVFVEAEKKGEDKEISFNSKFLIDLLRNIESKTVSIGVNSSVEPAVFKAEEDKDFVHIIMPVKIQE